MYVRILRGVVVRRVRREGGGDGDGVGDGGMSVAVSLSDAILESDSTALLSLIVVRPALDGSSRSPVFAAETVGAGICIYESDSGLHACKVRY